MDEDLVMIGFHQPFKGLLIPRFRQPQLLALFIDIDVFHSFFYNSSKFVSQRILHHPLFDQALCHLNDRPLVGTRLPA